VSTVAELGATSSYGIRDDTGIGSRAATEFRRTAVPGGTGCLGQQRIEQEG
jgi:hypothetical protein